MTTFAPNKLFYGWYIVAMAFTVNFMATGVGFYIFNAFMMPLCEEKGWTRAEVNLAPVIGGVVGLVGMYIFGTLVMRIGPRLLMTAGAVVSGAAFAGMGQVESILQFYLMFVLLFFGNGAMAGIVANTAVNNWFMLKRGKALGLATAGVSFSGVVLPLVAMELITYTDLEHAFLWIGISIICVAPVAWLVVRNRPEDHGLYPDGLVPESGQDLDSQENDQASCVDVNWTFSMVIRSVDFWKLGLVYAMAMMGVVAVMFQLAPRFIDLGFDERSAMLMMIMTALLGALGKYVWGYYCDLYDPRRVVATLLAATAFGLCLGLVKGSYIVLGLFILIFGFSMGGVVSTGPIMIAFLFGRNAYASVARFLGLVVRLQLVGYAITGLSYDLTGSYDTAYIIFIITLFLAAALTLTLKKAYTRANRHTEEAGSEGIVES